MRIFATPPYRDVPELLDRSDEATEAELRETLRDIRRANIFGLGTWVIKHHLTRLLRDHPKDRPLRILDLATGSADIPEELCRWSRKQGYDIRIVATDLSEPILEVARRRITRVGFEDRVTFIACDAARPPFPEKSFDVVTCSLAFHHLSLGQAREAMSEMARLSRKGFIINDVYRSQGAWYMAWVLSHATTPSRLTRHDGPASVYRAFTPAEIWRLAKQVGVCIDIHTHPFWRMAAVSKSES